MAQTYEVGDIGGGVEELEKCGKSEVVTVKMKPFKDWLIPKMSLDKFKDLPQYEQRGYWLQYKWGSLDERANEASEQSEKDTFNLLQRDSTPNFLANLNDTDRDYYTKRLAWRNYCFGIWKDIESGMFFL